MVEQVVIARRFCIEFRFPKTPNGWFKASQFELPESFPVHESYKKCTRNQWELQDKVKDHVSFSGSRMRTEFNESDETYYFRIAQLKP